MGIVLSGRRSRKGHGEPHGEGDGGSVSHGPEYRQLIMKVM
jgi:hypothetical protein